MKQSWLKEAEIRYGYSEKNRKKELTCIPEVIGKINSVLDFGCSAGFLLDILNADKKCGIEIDENARNIMQMKEYKVFRRIEDAPEGLDLIAMVDVIEHLDTQEVLDLLPKFQQKLRGRGRLFIQTCNPYNLISLMDFWNDFTHKRMYAMATLCALLKLNGFEIMRGKYVQPSWMNAHYLV